MVFMELIYGDRFIKLADYQWQDRVQMFSRGRNPENEIPIVFCKTDYLNSFFKHIGEMGRYSTVLKEYILLSHDSDGCIVPGGARVFDYNFVESKIPSRQRMWYAQNLDVLSSKIRPLPIGLENKKWHNGKKWEELLNIIGQNLPKKDSPLVYLNVEPTTNLSERQRCVNILRTKPFVKHSLRKPYLDYITEMAQHKFVACPEGNGFDTHRMWEALYLGCVPIVKKRVFTEILSHYLPIILINDWDEVEKSTLSLFVPSKSFKKGMDFEFWKRVVRGKISIA